MSNWYHHFCYFLTKAKKSKPVNAGLNHGVHLTKLWNWPQTKCDTLGSKTLTPSILHELALGNVVRDHNSSFSDLGSLKWWLQTGAKWLIREKHFPTRKVMAWKDDVNWKFRRWRLWNFQAKLQTAMKCTWRIILLQNMYLTFTSLRRIIKKLSLVYISQMCTEFKLTKLVF